MNLKSSSTFNSSWTALITLTKCWCPQHAGSNSPYFPYKEKIFQYRGGFFSHFSPTRIPLFSHSSSLRTAGSWAAWLVGACLSDRSAALDLTQLHTPFQSFRWVGNTSVGTLVIARTCVNVFLCAHCYMSTFCPCARFFLFCFFVRVCVFFLRENMQPLMCAKGFGRALWELDAAFCHTSSPPTRDTDPSRALMRVQRG